MADQRKSWKDSPASNNPHNGNSEKDNAQNDSVEEVTETCSILLDLLARIVYRDSVDVKADSPFVDQGIDSILAVEYVVGLEQLSGVRFSVETLYEKATPRRLAEHVDSVVADPQFLRRKAQSLFGRPGPSE